MTFVGKDRMTFGRKPKVIETYHARRALLAPIPDVVIKSFA